MSDTSHKKLLRKLVIAKMNRSHYNRTELLQVIKKDGVFSGRQISGMISYLEAMKWALKTEEGIYSFNKERYENDKRILKRIKNKKTIHKIKQESFNLKHKQLTPMLKSVIEIMEKSMKFISITETKEEMNYILNEMNIQLKDFLLSIQTLNSSLNSMNKEVRLFETIFELFSYVTDTFQTRPIKPFAFIVQQNKDFTYHDLLVLYELYCTKKKSDPFSLHIGSHDTKFLFHYLHATKSYLLQYQTFSEAAHFLNRTDDSIQYIYRKKMKLKKENQNNDFTEKKETHNSDLYLSKKFSQLEKINHDLLYSLNEKDMESTDSSLLSESNNYKNKIIK